MELKENTTDMNEIVSTNPMGKNITTSLIVSKIFCKEHKNVVRDIKNLHCSSVFNKLNFERIKHKDSRGRQQDIYEITKDGFSFLAMGYTGDKAAAFKEKFIEEFNKRDALLKNDDYIVKMAINILNNRTQLLEAKILNQKDTIQELAPKAKYHDLVLSSKTDYTTTTIAKELGLSAIALNKKLKAEGIIFKRDGHYVLFSKYQDKGYTKTRTAAYINSAGNIRTQINTTWTEAGREFLHNRFNVSLRQPIK